MSDSHLAPENCFVCGNVKDSHTPNTKHIFWSNADAKQDFNNEFQGNINVEARYVAQHRPY